MRKYAAVFVVALLAVVSMSYVGFSQVDEDNVITHETAKITRLDIQDRGSLYLAIGDNLYYTDNDDPLLHSALIAAFSNDLEVTVGISSSGVKTSESGRKSRKVTSVALHR